MTTGDPAATVNYANPAITARRRRWLHAADWSRLIWPAAALALILLFNYFFTPKFFALEIRDGRVYGILIDILHRGTPVMIMALGMTLVIATGGIDLSVGAVMAIAGAVAAVLIARPDFSPFGHFDVGGSIVAAVAIALAIALLAGLWNGVLVALLDIQPIIATLIFMLNGRGIAQYIAAGQPVNLQEPRFEYLAKGILAGLPFTVTIAAGMALLAGLLTRATALGLFIESVGNNARTSRYCGVNARLVKLMAYIFCGFCAGVAGIIATADLKTADPNTVGMYIELDAILAVSIGGTALTGGRFSLLGSLIGALVIQTLTTTILAQDVPAALTMMIKAAVVVMVCLLQSEQFRELFKRGWRKIRRAKA